MMAYKFLTLGAVGRFSEFRWPLPAGDEPAAWVETDAELDVCRHGIHACRADQLLDWLDDELWEIELGDELVESDAMLVARRGRVLRRVEAWDAATAQEFADACAWRSRDHALVGLRRVGLTHEAGRLVAAVELGELQAGAVSALERSEGTTAELSGFAADAVSLSQGHRPDAWGTATPTISEPVQTPSAIAANLAFVVAHAAGREAVAAAGSEAVYDAGFAAEREWQLGWLMERLGIEPS